jgi:hypothetical protein
MQRSKNVKKKISTGLASFYLLGFVLTEKSYAFELINSDNSDKTIFYRYQDELWSISMLKPEKLAPGGTNDFRQLLKDNFVSVGWNFTTGNSLTGTMDLLAYAPCRPGSNCPALYPDQTVTTISQTIIEQDQSGGSIVAKYTNTTSTPNPFGSYNNLRWIQRAKSNYLATACVNQGIFNYDSIDNSTCGSGNPYYDNVFGPVGPGQVRGVGNALGDRPRADAGKSTATTDATETSFFAETYLAEEIGNKNVKIYDGFSWGWRKKYLGKFQDVPASPLLASLLRPPARPGLGCLETSNGDVYYCSRQYAGDSSANLAIQENLDFTVDPSQQLEFAPASNVESVPTPAMLPGLVATGIYHGRKWRKRKQQNQNSDNAAA